MVGVFAVVLVLVLGAAASINDLYEPRLHNEELATPTADSLNYRLPGNLVPTLYDVTLRPYFDDEEQPFTFGGVVDIVFRVVADTDSIVIHKNKIDILEALTSVSKISIPPAFGGVIETSYDLDRHFYTIKLNSPMRAGETWAVHLEYNGILDSDMKGFYRSSYTVDGVTRWLGTTQLQATEARRAFPCFDEPALKAVFKIAIDHKATRHAISNMPVVSAINVGDRTKTTFENTPLMSTYLIAFIVSDFGYLEDQAAKLRIYSQPARVEQARYSLTVSPPILDWIADYVAINYTLPKMDEAAIPDFDAGAMENWGLVTYRERLILFEEGVSTSESKQRIATVIAHEYAHQWFGDLVSPHWWKDSWLNEGFATYFESFATAEVETTWRLQHQFVVRDLQSSMGADARETSHPISHDVCSPESISAIFDTITYEKAGSVIRMLKHIVTPQNFQQGLTSYLNKLEYSVARPRDLWESMDAQIRDDPALNMIYIPEVMDPWILQMGYPVVHVTRNYATFSMSLTQERFLLKKSETSPDDHVYKWHIPLTYTTESLLNFGDSNTLPSDWMTPEEDFKLIDRIPSNDWVLLNIQETGYYRVNYDEVNWNLLTTYLRSDNYEGIHLLNRAQLVDDAFNLARAGKTPYRVALALSLYLEKEIDYVPWYSAFQALSFIDNKLNNDERYHLLKIFVESLISKLYSHVGFEENAVDDHVMKLNRAAAVTWACKVGVVSCVQNSKEKLAQWIATPLANSIKPDIRSAVYCTAIREGGETEWNFLWNQYQQTTVATESTLLISALGCSEDGQTLQSYLMRSITENSGIRRQDARAVFTSVYNNPRGVDYALDFLIGTWQTTANIYGGLNALGSLFSGIANRLNTPAQVNKLQAFFTENAEVLTAAGGAAAISNANNIMEETLEWQTAHGQVIINWIEQHLQTTTTMISTSTTTGSGTTTTASGTTTTASGTTTTASGTTTTASGTTTTASGTTTTASGTTTTGSGTTTTASGTTTTASGTTTTGQGTTTPGAANVAASSIALFLAAIALLGIF